MVEHLHYCGVTCVHIMSTVLSIISGYICTEIMSFYYCAPELKSNSTRVWHAFSLWAEIGKVWFVVQTSIQISSPLRCARYV